MSILVTGGAGYIGSHTCLELLQAGYDVVVVDNLCNSSEKSLERVQEITGKSLTFYQVDLLDAQALNQDVYKRQDLVTVPGELPGILRIRDKQTGKEIVFQEPEGVVSEEAVQDLIFRVLKMCIRDRKDSGIARPSGRNVI